MGFKRSERVSELLKREISLLLDREVKDPDVGFVTVTAVEISDDLQYARIFVSVLGEAEKRHRAMEGLERAKGFLRRELGRRVELRYVPEIRFFLDESLDHALRIGEILRKIEPEGGWRRGEGDGTQTPPGSGAP